jgi:insulysin
MLFLGTKKYAAEDAYSGFLSAHGGSDNAETGNDQTTFYFDVQPSSLRDALDRFAQFFISPLFSPSAVSREINAVDAEHRTNLQDDAWRFNQMLSEVADEAHEYHGFGTGNSKTLGSVSVTELRAA